MWDAPPGPPRGVQDVRGVFWTETKPFNEPNLTEFSDPEVRVIREAARIIANKQKAVRDEDPVAWDTLANAGIYLNNRLVEILKEKPAEETDGQSR